MFNAITWPQYLGAVAVLLALYYVYVGLAYYRTELTGLLSGKGRGKAAAGDQATPDVPPSLLNRGPLIPKAAIVLPVAAISPPVAPQVAVPAMEVATDELEEDAVAEVSAEAPSEDEDQAQQRAGEEAEQECGQNQGNEFNEIYNYDVEISVNFTEPNYDEIDPTTQEGTEEAVEEFDEDFTVGVSQLSSYFDRAAEGALTQEQLVREVPELGNTDLLMAFFKTSTKSAQQLTAATYANVAEPAFN